MAHGKKVSTVHYFKFKITVQSDGALGLLTDVEVHPVKKCLSQIILKVRDHNPYVAVENFTLLNNIKKMDYYHSTTIKRLSFILILFSLTFTSTLNTF